MLDIYLLFGVEHIFRRDKNNPPTMPESTKKCSHIPRSSEILNPFNLEQFRELFLHSTTEGRHFIYKFHTPHLLAFSVRSHRDCSSLVLNRHFNLCHDRLVRLCVQGTTITGSVRVHFAVVKQGWQLWQGWL